MRTFLVWLPALVLYAAFLNWYVNWRGPLKPAEVEGYMARLRASALAETGRNQIDIVRQFLERDDGREFFMLNLVKISPNKVADPITGEPRPARDVLNGYTRVFMRALFGRGGHPALVARKIGGYVDAWGVEPDPGWSIIGYMRYRSRRDLVELVLDLRFGGAHAFKFAAMPSTFSFPTQPTLQASLSPTVAVGMFLALLAAMVQILWLVLLKG
jgi:hypothetical protein